MVPLKLWQRLWNRYGWLRSSTMPGVLIFGLMTIQSHETHCRPNYTATSFSHHILSLCRVNKINQALQLLEQNNHSLDLPVYSCLLQICGDMKALELGKRIHAQILRNTTHKNPILETNIITMYGKCGSLEEAMNVFLGIQVPDLFAWNSIIRSYSAKGLDNQVIRLYWRMRNSGIFPDSFALVNVLKACANLGSVEHGRAIHHDILRGGFHSDVFVDNALCVMYGKCGFLEDARQVFDTMSTRDTVSWNGMISRYVGGGRCVEAAALVMQMQTEGVKFNSTTLVGILPICGVKPGMVIHGFVIKNGFDGDRILLNSIASLYARLGMLNDARSVFDKMTDKNADVASWNVMISGYVQSGMCHEALSLFREMQQVGLEANCVTVSSALRACSNLVALAWGRQIHACIYRDGFDVNVIVISALMDMYAKCGNLQEALFLFKKMPVKDVVAWNAITGGFSQHSCNAEAMELFKEMLLQQVRPDAYTLVSALCACAKLSDLLHGQEVHDYVTKRGLESNTIVGSALVDMYAKCGALDSAKKCFDRITHKDLVSWNAMIMAYAAHGYGREALQMFAEIQELGFKPDQATFTGILAASSHAGLVEEGKMFFRQLHDLYSVTPTMEHYTCMVDLLGRAGLLDEADELVKRLPVKPNYSVLASLLGACRSHHNLEMAEEVSKRLFDLDPEDDRNYVLLSNIFASAGRWSEAREVRKIMKHKGIKKTPGCSWIQVRNKVHVFFRGNINHPQIDAIQATLQSLTDQIKLCGYVPETSPVLYDIEEAEKEHILYSHSERLAIAFGLMSTCKQAPIRVTTNLRVCCDCHSAIKLISKVTQREIIVRDTTRFHHYKDGLCSCGDYW